MRPKPVWQMQSRKETIMKVKMLIAVCLAALCAAYAQAQEPKLPKNVKNTKVYDLGKNLVSIPNFGEKNLIIFFLDPDNFMQNNDFQNEFEAGGYGTGKDLFSFGIVNKYDSLIPMNWIVSQAKKRTANNGGTALVDIDGNLAKDWGLGDCNNMFVLLVVSKEGELVYCHKGKLSRADIDDFYKFIEAYK